MAGDWIPCTKDLERKLEFARLVELSGLSKAEVFYHLLTFWMWVDNETEDGILRHASVTLLSQLFVTAPGAFWTHMQTVGWLKVRGDSIEIPNFDNWMGNSAKKRLKAAERKRKSRENQKSQSGVGHASVTKKCDHRTEQNNIKKTPTPLGDELTHSTPSEGNQKPTPEENQQAEKPLEEKKTQEIAFRTMPCDKPELAVIAKRITEHYRKIVKSPNPWGGATVRLIELLDSGHTEQQLRLAAENYAKHCERNKTENRHRQGAAKFYAEQGEYWAFKDYKDERSEKPKTVNLDDLLNA